MSIKTIFTIKSTVETVNGNIDVIKEAANYAYILLIKTDSVQLLRGTDSFSTENLVELRAFSSEKELHLMMTPNGLCGRIRQDETGEDTEVYEEKQLLWGTVEISDNAKSILKDSRGFTISVPLTADKGDRISFTIRNYLAKDSFTFEDSRLCGLSAGKAVKYNG